MCFESATLRSKRADHGLLDSKWWTEATNIPAVQYLNPSESNRYFHFHHSDGDYLGVIEAEDLDQMAALHAILAYVIAERGYQP